MNEPTFLRHGHRHRSGGFLETVALGLMAAMDHALDAEAMAARPGLLQALDPRAKLAGLLALIVATVLVSSLLGLAALFVLAVCIALGSRISVIRLSKQVWIGVLLFTGVIALPALVLVAGRPVLTLPGVGWTVTEPGLRSAAFLVGRAETAATFALLLVLSTPWPHVLKAMRALGMPVVVVAILGMTHRYIFVLLQAAIHMFEARRSRVVGPMNGRERRRLVGGTAGALLGRTFHLATEVHLAMVSRGYRGEVRLIDDFMTRARDWAALAAALAVPVLVLWVQR